MHLCVEVACANIHEFMHMYACMICVIVCMTCMYACVVREKRFRSGK
jgi:hypothetical protein